MLLKLDKNIWVEIPDNATEEFKQAKIKKYTEEKEENLKRLKKNVCSGKRTYKKSVIGSLYDSRVNLTNILKNLR